MELNWELASGTDAEGNEILHVSLEGSDFLTICTTPEAPEDNTVSRLGLEAAFEKVIKACWPDRLIFKYGITENGEIDLENERDNV